MKSDWVLYLLLSCDGKRTYVGVTTDLNRRVAQHNGAKPGGAKSTRGGRPWTLLKCREGFSDRSAAQTAEAALKQLQGDKRVGFFD